MRNFAIYNYFTICFAVPKSVSNEELDVLVNITNHEDIQVKFMLNAAQAISGPRKPDTYNVSVNFIDTDEPLARNIFQCPNNALYSDIGNVTLTLNCDIHPNELCTFNISASNEAGKSLIFENGKLSEFHQVPWT